MIITAKVDSADWAAAMDVLLAASEEQARQASLQVAEEIGDLAKEFLSMQFHAPGTKTPSAPGTPPALISGALMASVDWKLFGDVAWVGPTSSASSRNGPYGRIQELGGLMEGHPWMHYFEEGREHWRHRIFLPARPYLAPATAAVIDSGRLWTIYAEHQTEAIMEATG